MNLNMMNLIFGMALLSAVGLMGPASAASVPHLMPVHLKEQDISRSQAEKLEGTWLVEITVRNCQTGAEVRTFPSLATFALGGTLTGTTAGFSPTLVSPFHGVWSITERHTFTAVSLAFLFTPDGRWAGTQMLVQDIEFGDDQDKFMSTGTTETVDPNGNPIPGIGTGCATAVGRRVE